MNNPVLQIETATAADAERLAALRLEAMRPSLEAAGRFDPDRARARFLRSFVPSETHLLLSEGNLAGFYVLRVLKDHFYLDHLYLATEFQGQGAGRAVVNIVQQKARAAGLPVRLVALNVSEANRFYRSSGFKAETRPAMDTSYEWRTENDTHQGSDSSS